MSRAATPAKPEPMRPPPPPPSSRTTSLIAILVLGLLLLTAFRTMTFGGLEPLAVDTSAADAHRTWLDDRWAEGEFPQWYPDVLLGMPSYPSFIWTPASPLSWVHNTLDLNRGTRYVLWLFIGGVGAFFLFRRWGGSVPAAFAATVAVVFTPYVFGLVNAGHSSKLMALAFAPLVWLAVDTVLSRPNGWTVGLASWAIALQLWANHPQIVFYSWLLLGPYAVLRWWFDDTRRRWTAPAALAAAFALALLMVALPYLPVQAYTHESTRGAISAFGEGAASGTQSWDYATNWSFHPRELISLVFPSFFGLKSPTYWGWMPFTQSTHAIGTVPLVLAVIGLFVIRGWRRWFLVGSALAVLLIGFGRHVPVLFAPLYHGFPFFDKFRVPSMIYAMLPLLAAFAMVPAIDGAAAEREHTTRTSRVLVGLVALFGVAALFGLGGLAGLGGGLADSGWFHRMFDPALERPSFDLVAERRAMLFGDLTRASFLALGTLGVLWLSNRRRVSPVVASSVILVLLGIDLYTVDRPFYDPKPKAEARTVSRVSDSLADAVKAIAPDPRVLPIELVPQRTEDGRATMLVVSGLLQSNDYGFHRIESVAGYHPAGLARMKDFILSGAWRNAGLWPALGIDAVVFHARAAGVPESFWQEIGAQYPGTTLVHHESGGTGDVAVFTVDDGLGRAFVVPEVIVVPEARERLLRMSSDAFDPTRSIVVDSPLDVRVSGEPGRVTALDRTDERVAVTVTGGGGALVLTDAHASGWRARLDGAEVPIVPANHVVRSVALPPGDHEVVFEYRDPLFAWARNLHHGGRVLSVLAIVVGVVVERRRRGHGTADA